MHIFIKISAERTITLEVAASDTIASIKTKIYGKEGIPTTHQLLMFAGIELEDCRALSHYYIKNISTLQMATRMPHQTVVALVAAERRASAAEEALRITEEARKKWSEEAIRLAALALDVGSGHSCGGGRMRGR